MRVLLLPLIYYHFQVQGYGVVSPIIHWHKQYTDVLSSTFCDRNWNKKIANSAFYDSFVTSSSSSSLLLEATSTDSLDESRSHVLDEEDNGNNAEVLEKKLRYQFQQYENTKKEEDKPSKELFNQMIEVWLRFPLPARAEIVLDKMEELYQPDGRLYERIVNAWCFEAEQESTNPFLSETAALLNDDDDDDDDDELQQRQQQREKEEYGKIKATKAAQMAIGILNRMEQLYRETGDVDFRPALSTYTSVMNAFRRSGAAATGTMELIDHLTQRRDIIYQALDTPSWKLTSDQDVLDLISYLDDDNVPVSRNIKSKLVYKKKGSLATTRNFNIIINELSKSDKKWAGQRAEDILDYMIYQYQTGLNKHLKPDIVTINGCIDAWARSSSQPNFPLKAQAIVDKLTHIQRTQGILLNVIPDTVTYNCLINAWAKSGDSNQAEAILALMEDNNMPLTTSKKSKPDIVTYCSVLNALANVAHNDNTAAKKAEDILTQMHQRYKSDDAKLTVKPNTRCFNIVIKCHANSKSTKSGDRSVLLLDLMQDMSIKGENKDVAPDTFSYNTVLLALANCRQAEKAHSILERMEAEFNNGNHLVRPDTISYNTVIRAYALSGSKGYGKVSYILSFQIIK